MGSQIVGIFGVRKFWLVVFKSGKGRSKKTKQKNVGTEITVVPLI